jgi:hypothetical protein
LWRRSSSFRHCERSEAIQNHKKRLDCFASLAMTVDERSRESLSRFWRNIPDPRAVHRDIVHVVFEMHALVRCRLRFCAYASTPWLCGPDRPRCKAAAAVRANIFDFGLDAIRAKRAFIAADAGFCCVRRQVLVAIFAVRSKLQRHGRRVPLGRSGLSQIRRPI